MGFRVRKSVRLLPGVKLNFSLKRGVSATVGGRGFSHNIGADGRRRTTVGIPGSGVSHTTAHRTGGGQLSGLAKAVLGAIVFAVAFGLVSLFT